MCVLDQEARSVAFIRNFDIMLTCTEDFLEVEIQKRNFCCSGSRS